MVYHVFWLLIFYLIPTEFRQKVGLLYFLLFSRPLLTVNSNINTFAVPYLYSFFNSVFGNVPAGYSATKKALGCMSQ